MPLTNDQKKAILSELDQIRQDASGSKQKADRLKKYLKTFFDTTFPPALLGMAFEIINPPDNDGFSEWITIDTLTTYHPSFRTKNGGDWCRSNLSYLGKKYDVKRQHISNRIYAVKLDGFNKNKTIQPGIRKDIFDEISKKRCAILDISRVEVDHKNGKKDEHHLNDLASQSLNDFQPLSKAANDAKREHCKRCKATGRRYDAKRLGYKESFTKGDFTTDNCQGCYWYDPQKFNEEISQNFVKTR